MVGVSPHPRHVAKLFDVICVVPKEPNQNDLRDSVLGLFDQPLFQFDFDLFDLGQFDRRRSSRLQLSIHLSLVVVLHPESPVLCRPERTRLHPLQALKNPNS